MKEKPSKITRDDKLTFLMVAIALLSFALMAYVIKADSLTVSSPDYLKAVMNEGYHYETLISINLADITELDRLPGIGPTMAERIIEYREANGDFKELEDLLNVSGIGEKTFIKLKAYICL